MLRLGLIGRGRWGRNIERTLAGFSDVSLAVLDRDASPSRDLDAVLIATPSATHAEIALRFLAGGIPVFIEKPMATTAADAGRIAEAADRSGAVVFVGHILQHNGAFLAALDLLPRVGRVRYVLCEGMNSNPRRDSSVLWDWLPHHLTIGHAMFGAAPSSASAWSLTGAEIPRAVVSRFLYGGVPMISTSSWLSPTRRQQVVIAGENGTIVFDDKAERKIVLHGADGSVLHPTYGDELPLTRELRAFVDLVRSGKPDRSQIELGVAIVRAIAAAEQSLAQNGALVPIEAG